MPVTNVLCLPTCLETTLFASGIRSSCLTLAWVILCSLWPSPRDAGHTERSYGWSHHSSHAGFSIWTSVSKSDTLPLTLSHYNAAGCVSFNWHSVTSDNLKLHWPLWRHFKMGKLFIWEVPKVKQTSSHFPQAGFFIGNRKLASKYNQTQKIASPKYSFLAKAITKWETVSLIIPLRLYSKN